MYCYTSNMRVGVEFICKIEWLVARQTCLSYFKYSRLDRLFRFFDLLGLLDLLSTDPIQIILLFSI